MSSTQTQAREENISRASRVKVAAFDVDGVLTDGRLYYSDSGQEMKAFSAHDGQGLKMLSQSGVHVAIITSRRSKLVQLRAQELGITSLYQGVDNKLLAMKDLLQSLNLDFDQASYMGDDLIDLSVMRRCVCAASVKEAPSVVQRFAHFVATQPAGGGAVREFADWIMQAQGQLEAQWAPYLTD